MKRLLALIMALVILLTYLTFASAESYPCDGYTTKTNVLVRKDATTKSKQVGKISKKGTKVTVHGSEVSGKDTWYQVTTGNGKEGYIRGDLLRLEASESAAPAAQTGKSVLPEKLAVGDKISLGKWEQDNKTKNGKEAIQWQVLAVEGRRALLIAVDGLETELYGASIFDEGMNWETSLLRKWMNNTFYNDAFTQEEKAVIQLASLKTGSLTTEDHVFTLSVAEAKKYFASNAAMACKPTAYAKKQINQTYALDSKGYGVWWLRDMASTYKQAPAYAFMEGTMNEVAYVNLREGIKSREGLPPVFVDSVLARPAVWVELPSQETPATTASEAEKSIRLKELAVGDQFLFGQFEQDGDQSNGKEAIEWLVLAKEKNRILALSKHSLDHRPYITTSANPEWKNSTLRSWLNDTFFYEAFSEKERAVIPTVTVAGMEDPDSLGLAFNQRTGELVPIDKPRSADTKDKIFILSDSELIEYRSENNMLRCEPTNYARQRGASGLWWLRSGGFRRGIETLIHLQSNAITYSDVDGKNNKNDVRPSMWIDLKSDIKVAVPEPTPIPTSAPATPTPSPAAASSTVLSDVVTDISQAAVGDYITFGVYEQDNNTDNGKEPIEWLVLAKEKDALLVISRFGLDNKPLNEKHINITWEHCTLRSWLNNDFFDNVFNAEEKSKIPTVTVPAHKNPEHNSNPGNDTQDKIFLLSIEEAQKYFSPYTKGACVPTIYAENQGVYTFGANGGCHWWLRTSGHSDNSAAYVYQNGLPNMYGSAVFVSRTAVRPAMWIQVESSGEQTAKNDPTPTPAPTATPVPVTPTPIPAATPAPAAKEAPASDFVYASNGKEIQINGYQGPGGHVVIPTEIEGLPVTRIATSAFEDNESITGIVLPQRLEYIGNSAFSCVYNLTGVMVLPETVKTVDWYAFMYTNLTGLVVQSDCEIGGNAFIGTEKLEFVYVAEGCAPQIETAVFPGIKALKTVVFPASVTTIGEETFEGSNYVTLYTPAGSAAAKYANDNFIRVDTENYVEKAAEFARTYDITVPKQPEAPAATPAPAADTQEVKPQASQGLIDFVKNDMIEKGYSEDQLSFSYDDNGSLVVTVYK